MKIKILGCGTSIGVPIPGCECAVCLSTDPRDKRTRTSAIFSVNGQNILIDATTDLRIQALTHGIKRVDAVLFTHAHADHILGTDDLRCFNFIKRAPIPCFGTKETLDQIRDCFKYIFSPDPLWEGGQLAQLELHELDGKKTFEACGQKIHPFPLVHGRTSVLGFRIGDIAYATDCKAVPEFARSVLRGVKVLFLDGLRYEDHATHFTIDEAIKVAQEIGAEKTYLIHTTHSVSYKATSAKLPSGIELAYDGLEVEL